MKLSACVKTGFGPKGEALSQILKRGLSFGVFSNGLKTGTLLWAAASACTLNFGQQRCCACVAVKLQRSGENKC